MATIFVLLSLPVSIYEIAMHLENFNRPKLQTRIIRILGMVPIYALDRCAGSFTPSDPGVLHHPSKRAQGPISITQARGFQLSFCRSRTCGTRNEGEATNTT